MWLRSANGLVCSIYGACQVQAEIDGVVVKISESTNYPFDPKINFQVEVARPVEFTISFRKPNWAIGVHLTGADSTTERGGLIHIRKTWQTGDEISLCFEADVKIQPWHAQYIISYGPLLFCLPLDGVYQRGREYAPGYQDAYYTLANSSTQNLRLSPQTRFTPEQHPFDPTRPFSSLILKGELIATDNSQVPVRLIPLGGSILRKSTFEAL
jgi:hypothetical protein